MEDRYVVESPLDESWPEAHLLAVFDGHRGAEAAEFSGRYLRGAFSKALGQGSAEACLKVAGSLLSIEILMPPSTPSTESCLRAATMACMAIRNCLMYRLCTWQNF